MERDLFDGDDGLHFNQISSISSSIPTATTATAGISSQSSLLAAPTAITTSTSSSSTTPTSTFANHHGGLLIGEHGKESGGHAGVSLSVLLAHIGHNVGEMETDKDVEIYIVPWGDHCDGVKRKRVNALRVYLKLKEMVLVWYDVVIPDE